MKRRTAALPPGKVATKKAAKSGTPPAREAQEGRATRVILPGAFGPPPFDFLQELETNLDEYAAPDNDATWLSITCLPGYIDTALGGCRANCKTVKAPAQAPTIVCAISHGIDRFFGDEEIEDLLRVRNELLRVGGKAADSNLLEMANEFFRRFPLGLPGTMSRSKRVNVPVPNPIKKPVAERASELGLGIAEMAVLAIAVTISEQTVVHPDHAALASETIEKFFRQVRVRRKIAQVFLEELG